MYFLKIVFENWNKSLHPLIQLSSFFIFYVCLPDGVLMKTKAFKSNSSICSNVASSHDLVPFEHYEVVGFGITKTSIRLL